MVSQHPLFSLGEQFSNFLISGLFVLKIEDPQGAFIYVYCICGYIILKLNWETVKMFINSFKLIKQPLDANTDHTS